ncbi:DUF262 domain-containing protein [Aeromonas caviae]|uniref:DUF262 domain-containing protein n=2 Tax=Aeromonas caviae TaxID=648 RepID=A0AA42RAK7_AERCA|nr:MULTISPECIES: DUF262 domain-containing protein [Aeromonas]MDH0436491.1 DUF262 domain-containing protein [Aeromonas caviae]MDH0477468.1 DUF262 domain-containing protein [Aeromonas caviae]MDH0939181.1 DUF262 domain-containing protein [Aeromonas caviae]MDH1399967.1 DUF262 domain-containing protein [Aeromonas caviae]MDH1506809.1 DUF262 domain-containing protein [Aeromonas caviae]
MSYEEKNAALDQLIRPLPNPRYTIDASFRYIEHQLNGYEQDWGGLNLEPDFQRGHVWTHEQRVAFIEGIFRGTVGESQRIIQFNVPHWDDENHGGDLPNEIQIVDGLQRLTTVRMFMAGEIAIFGGLKASDLDGSKYAVNRPSYRLQFAIHNFANRADLLRYYLAINSGGTPHSTSEIERVKGLLAAADRAV